MTQPSPSSFSTHTALLSNMAEVSSGIKFAMINSFSFKVRVSWRMASNMSARSVCDGEEVKERKKIKKRLECVCCNQATNCSKKKPADIATARQLS